MTADRPLTAENRTDVLIYAASAATGAALQGVPAGPGVVGSEMAPSGAGGGNVGGSGGFDAGGLEENERLRAEGYEVRCPHCHALQFLARAPWECVAIDEATMAIRCWRRMCKRVLGLRPVSGQAQLGQAQLGQAQGPARTGVSDD